MKHKLLFLILFFSNCIYSQFDNLKNNSNELEAKYIKNQLFVKIKDEIDFNPINAIEPREFSNKIKITKAFKLIELQKIYLVEVLDSSITTDSVIRFFTKNEAVEYVERVPLYELFWTPNDPMYLQQWNLQKVQADLAWNISQGKQQIRVAITDDGFLMNHEDLASKWFINSAENPTNGIDDDNNGYIDDWRGWDAADNDNNPAAFNTSNNYFDHGTHVAGITTVATNNAKGIAGIGGNIQLIPVKIGANSNASFTGAYQGVEYAIIANANVINMSWGGGAFSQTYQNLFNVAKSKNIVCVAAAGNSSTSSWMYPASYQNVISVASTTNTDALSWFSNFGTAIDVCAPGSNILSCHATGITNYTNMSGTSMAAPLVSGLCGLMLSHNLMPADSIEACLKRTSNNINANNPNRIGQIGAGRINAFQALQCTQKAPLADFEVLDSFQCINTIVRYKSNSSGIQPLTYSWSFPGGTPSSSTLANPQVTYSSPGLYSATLTVSNNFGTNTITNTNIVRIGTPTAKLSGRKYTTYGTNAAILAISFIGTPPYNITLTDGSNIWTQNNITSNPYFYSITPIKDTSLIQIQSFSDKNCVGIGSVMDTIVKLKSANTYTSKKSYNCLRVKSHQLITESVGGFNYTLPSSGFFGMGCENIGDWNNDGINDLLVGAPLINNNNGKLFLLNLNTNGTVKAQSTIDNTNAPFSGINNHNNTQLGVSFCLVGDIDQDGIKDIIATGSHNTSQKGSAFVLFMNGNGTVKAVVKWEDGLNGIPIGTLEPFGRFGWKVSSIGDWDNDGTPDVIIGAGNSNEGGSNKGAIYICLINTSGTVKQIIKNSSLNNTLLNNTINNEDRFGSPVFLGDINKDGLKDFAVGTCYRNFNGVQTGGVFIVSMNSAGSVVQILSNIGPNSGGFNEALNSNDLFGYNVSGIGDYDKDGINDIIVGAIFDDDGGLDKGAAWILFLNSNGTVKRSFKISQTKGNFKGGLSSNSNFGFGLTNIGDLDNNGYEDFAVGSYNQTVNGISKGAVWVLFMEDTCSVDVATCDTSGLILCMSMDGNANDSTKYNNHGIVRGATPTIGRDGKTNSAFFFSGNSNHINLGVKPILKPNQATISMWLKLSGVSSSGFGYNLNPILVTGNTNSPFSFSEAYLISINTSGARTLNVYSWNPSPLTLSNPNSNPIPLNTWKHIVVTYNNDSMVIFVDGVREKAAFKGFPTNFSSIDSIVLGYSGTNNSNQRWFHGSIDELKMYNRVLSPNEIMNLYTKPFSCNCTQTSTPTQSDCDTTNLNVGRVLHLDFNGNTQDKSGNNNHATNFGATPVAGKNGTANTAYRFDGINDFMRVNHHSSLNMTNITLTAVLKPNGFYNGTCYGNQIIKKGNTDFVSGEYGLGYSPNGYTNSCFVFDTVHQNYAGYVFNNRPSPNLNNTSPYVIKGQWDCLVYTKNNDSTKFYINGVLKYATASNSHGSNLDDIFIGKMDNWQYPYWLKADIDDIQIYNRVLSASEVKGYCETCNINPPANDCDTTNLNVGRVLHLDFNGNTQDKSGNNNHATNFGATPVAGKNGAANTAYRFDGINDFMEINSSPTTNITSNISIAAIIKVNGFNPKLPQNASSVLTKGNDNSVGFYTLRFTDDVIQNNADTNTSQFYGQFTNDGIVNIYNSTCDVPPFINKNNWSCAIYTFNGDTAKMYINGQLIWKFKTNTQIGNNNQKIRIGNSFHNFPYEFFLKADIDDIRIYNRVLSASEVKGYCGSCNISSPIEKACSKGFKQTIPKCTQETLILNSSNGTKHLWSPKLGLSNDTIQNPICSINQNTTYYSTKIDSAGCQILDTFIIQIRAVSKFEPISDTLICIGDSATINITNRTNPIWSPNTHIRAFGTNDFKLFPNQSTDYILNYQDTFGCSFKDTISIKTKICCSLRAQFEMSKTNLCFGDSLMVNNSSSSISGVSFDWSIQPNTVSMANYIGIQPPTLFFENAGDYTIELIGDNGSCKDTFVKTILVTKLNPNAGNDTFYCGNALQYQLGESPIRGFKYSWNPPTGLNHSNISNPTLSITNQKIDYILQLEDTLSGCRFYDTVVVSAFNFKNFSKIIDTLICGRDSIMVSLPSFTKLATWKNAIHISDSLSKQPLLFPKDTQRYIVHFEDSNRCQYQDTFDLFTKICCEHLPHFLVAKNTICFGETLQITENSTYKTPVNHKWKVIPNTVSPSFSSGKTPPNFQFLDSGKYQIWLTIYDSFCIDSFLREVKVVRIYPNAGIDQSSCRLQNNFSLGFPPVDGYQYVWTPSLYLSNPFISNPTASVFRDSIRYILETRDIASQCVFNYAVDIKTKRVIDSSITFDTLCEKSTLDFHGNILNTSGFYDTILSDVLNTCDSIYKATHLFIYPRKDSLWTQQYGCKSFRYKNTVFEKDTFLLDSIFNSKGCLISILQIPIEILNTTIEDSTIIACGSYLHNGLLLTESYKRIKTNRVPFFRRPTCDSVWRNIGLNILPAPKAIIEPDNKNNPIPYGTKLNLEGKGGDFYQWNFENSTEKSIVYEAFQDYRFTLVVSLQNECKDTATYFVKVGEIPDGKIVFPNAFSPNGDQVNDYFKPNSYQFGALVSLSIFNRWGEKIFENFNQDAYWDGIYKNEIQPSGVYIYIATFKSPKGDLKTIKGDFLLVR